jgi:hypothetical protein
MTKYVIYGLAAIVLISLGTFAMQSWKNAERDAAVEAERRARLADAVELIKERDKLTTTLRTATPADICNRLGGKTIEGVCQ